MADAGNNFDACAGHALPEKLEPGRRLPRLQGSALTLGVDPGALDHQERRSHGGERRFQLFRIPAQQRPKCRNGGIGRHAFGARDDRLRPGRGTYEHLAKQAVRERDVASGFRGHAAGHPAAIVLVDGSRMSGGVALESAGYVAFADGLFGQMFVRSSPQSEAIIARAKRMPANTAVAAFRSLLRWDAEKLEAALAAVRAPLMVIQSTWINPERKRASLKAGQTSPWLELLRQRVPGARIEVVPGVGHFTQLEAADTVNRLIGED